MKRQLNFSIIFIAMLLVFSGATPAEEWDDDFCFSSLVSIKNVKFHQKVLEKIAMKNEGTRASGTAGYDLSTDYVAFMLRVSGYDVDVQTFDFPFFQELSDPAMAQVFPTPEVYPPNDDAGFYTMTYSGSGEVTGTIEPVDIMIPPGLDANSSTSGCEPEDFNGFTRGNIALIQRGSCYFYDKAINAQNAGAIGVIIFNEGQPGRTGAVRGTLGQPEFFIPVVGASFDVGASLNALAQTDAVSVSISTDTVSEIRETRNIIAETRHGDAANTVIVGAHLDSVIAGPGINDNGSGSAAILETAMKLGWLGGEIDNKVRFAFWGAEELGLIGSEFYVAGLTPEELADIGLYLNFDMVGSPNYVRFVYDGDGSDTGNPAPPGSGEIENFFVDYFTGRGLPTDPVNLGGSSDYAPFMAAGVPIGGLFTGAGGLKTPEQAEKYGGTAGAPYDPNYHTANDLLENINFTVEKQMLKAIANAVFHFAENPLPVREIRTLRAAAPDFEYKGPLLQK